LEADAAVAHALKLVEEGADMIDVGGESTRPGSGPVECDEELRRVIPVVEGIARRARVPISIDTSKAVVAERAIGAGAVIVNDVTGLRSDPRMIEVCRAGDAGVICMHMQGTPQTMQAAPHYDDVVGEICLFFQERLAALEAAGIPAERVVLDPGVGFGKTARHNLEILAHIGRFRALGRPVLVGHSRKRFLAKVLGRPVDEREAGTLGVSVALAEQSVDILRVHDVRATRDVLLAWRAVRGADVERV
jgi:dihydropteroate synthase